MLTKENAIGAIVTLKCVNSMPNNTPLTVIDFTDGDCGTKYKKSFVKLLYIICFINIGLIEYRQTF